MGSTILITASGVVTCAMRRTLVSRKARKRRIAENAEMSGANFYARQAEESRMAGAINTDSKSPIVNGAPGADNLPAFAVYNSRRSEERSIHEPIPLDPISTASPVDGGRFYSGTRSRSSSRPRQEIASPAGPPLSYEDAPPMPASPPRGAYGPPRGRGGYPPRGAMSSRGPPPSPYGRGGFPVRGRGGYPQGPTPPGMVGVAMSPPGMSRRPPPGYGPQESDGSQAPYGPPEGVRTPGGSQYRPDGTSRGPASPSSYGPGSNPGYGAYGARAQSPARRQSPYGSRAQSPSAGRSPQEMPPPMPMIPYGSRTQSPSGRRPSQELPPPMPTISNQSQYAPRPQPNLVYDAVVQQPYDMPRMTPQISNPPPMPPSR